jgi:hypothetical protein
VGSARTWGRGTAPFWIATSIVYFISVETLALAYLIGRVAFLSMALPLFAVGAPHIKDQNKVCDLCCWRMRRDDT